MRDKLKNKIKSMSIDWIVCQEVRVICAHIDPVTLNCDLYQQKELHNVSDTEKPINNPVTMETKPTAEPEPGISESGYIK